MCEAIFAMIISIWISSITIASVILIYSILSDNGFIFETFKFVYYVEQIKHLCIDKGLYCPFSPENKKKYTKAGICILSTLWILTFGIAFIPALIIAYIIWADYWLFIKLCIKNPDEE